MADREISNVLLGIYCIHVVLSISFNGSVMEVYSGNQLAIIGAFIP